jgi:alpha-galactosidase
MPDGSGPLPGGINDIWGGIVNGLDTTHPEVLDHLEGLARSLVEAGFSYLKLDFTYSPSFEGRYFDPSKTPAERVRAGYDAIRRGAGDDTFILGCGAPLGPCIGVVDGMRIGPDVAPHWWPGDEEWAPEGYRDTLPATVNGWQSTIGRSFMHRRLWLNDPDCLMLRTDATEMTVEQVHAWAECVAVSGGMAIVSDDLALLGADARALLERVIAVGREVDAAAISGAAPECPDLMDHRPPTTLHGAGHTLEGDPVTGAADLRG